MTRQRFPRATVLAFRRGRGLRRWTVTYTNLIAGDPHARLVTRRFWTKQACRRFAARFRRDAAFF